MPFIVPIKPLPFQSLQAQLNQQAVVLNIQQLPYGLFVDVYIGITPIILGVLAHDLNRIVRSKYLGFVGDLVFVDTQGDEDPVYTGLGSRYLLAYLEEADLPDDGG